MTYGEMKEKIFSLLDIDGSEIGMAGSLAERVLDALPEALNTTARKAALHFKPILKQVVCPFIRGAAGLMAEMPTDGFGVFCVQKGERIYTAECFALIGQNILLFEKAEGEYTVSYYAFPESVDADTADTAVPAYDARMADAVTFGTAGELSHLVYPSDMTRYMRLMTEYDERVSTLVSRVGDAGVKNAFFQRKRGV